MRLFGRIERLLALAFCLLLPLSVLADDGVTSSYSPYSIYGIGDLMTPGTAYNHSMGGVGIANRNRKYLNPLNPASVTARDTLAFMADFSVHGENKYYFQGNMRSAHNSVNINDLIISFPIWRSSAMMVGVRPLSSTGFGYRTEYTDPAIIGRTGKITYEAEGTGGLYQVFLGAGVTFWKRLSIGAEASYSFGHIKKEYRQVFANASYSGANTYYELSLSSFTGRFGLQYEQPLGKRAKLCIGATYALGNKIGGYVEKFKLSSSTASSDTLFVHVDTLSHLGVQPRLASELGVGISLRVDDKWMLEFDYTRSDWTKCNFSTVDGFAANTSVGIGKSIFSTTVSETYRLGFELVPNRNDIRYYMRTCAYRAGVYYRRDYYKLDGYDIHSIGMTVGMTFPVFRLHNGLTAALEGGRRGGFTAGLANNLISEWYFNFTVGLNIFDIWFQKPRYD